MNKFMQTLLASFGVMALMLAGCTPASEEATEETGMDGTSVEETSTMEDSSMKTEETSTMEDSSMKTEEATESAR